MTLFQRIKTPFAESAADDHARLQPRQRQVGDSLQERREDLGLDLDEIGAMLRIKPAYLAALEQGRSDDLPGPAYAIGFVRAYADFLGLNTEQVLARFKGEVAGVTARPDLALPVPLGERSLPGRALVLVALIVTLCGYGIWYYLSTDDRNRPERVAAVPAELRTATVPFLVSPPTAQPTAEAVAAPNPAQTAPPPNITGAAANPNSAAPAKPAPPAPPAPATPPQQVAAAASPRPAPPTVAPQPAAPMPPQQLSAVTQPKPAPPVAAAPAPVPPAAPPQLAAAAQPAPPPPHQTAAKPSPPPAPGPVPSAASKISIRALADCWIQIRGPDQSIVFSRILKSGEVYNVPVRQGLSLRTGNAGVLEISVDGKQTPSIGGIGALRRDVALDPVELAAGTAVHG